MSIKITRKDGNLFVRSPYNSDLPSRAKLLSGRWDGDQREWVFPIGAETEVRDLYLSVYGEWEDTPADTVTVVVIVTKEFSPRCAGIYVSGIPIAKATGRDSGARTFENILLVSGKVGSCGSVKNWHTYIDKGTIFKILNVPRIKADSLVGDHPDWCSIEIEGESLIDKDALIDEKERLLSRLAIIEEMLNRG